MSGFLLRVEESTPLTPALPFDTAVRAGLAIGVGQVDDDHVWLVFADASAADRLAGAISDVVRHLRGQQPSALESPVCDGPLCGVDRDATFWHSTSCSAYVPVLSDGGAAVSERAEGSAPHDSGTQLDAIGRDLDAAGDAWVAAGYPSSGPVFEAREAVFLRLRAWNDAHSPQKWRAG